MPYILEDMHNTAVIVNCKQTNYLEIVRHILSEDHHYCVHYSAEQIWCSISKPVWAEQLRD